MITDRQFAGFAVCTHASSVMPVASDSDVEWFTVTQLVAPSNVSAPPNFPAGFQEAPASVPVLPLPVASAVVVPLPSLKPYAATSPVCANVGTGTARRAHTNRVRHAKGTNRLMSTLVIRVRNFSARADFHRVCWPAAVSQGVLWGAVFALCATSAPALRAHSRPTDVTYLKDVAPILQKRCTGCHASAGSAFPLDSYERARQHARSIRESVLDRRMPPWPAAPGFGDYRNDRSLTPIEIELLTAWVDGRTPLGAGDPIAAEASSRPLSRDAIGVALPAGHPSRAPIEVIEVRVPLREPRSITEWEFHPTAPAAITRAILFVNGVRLGSWVPSQGRERFPEGVAVDAPANSRLT